MPRPRAAVSVIRFAEPLRSFAHRFSFALLVGAAVALMVFGRVDQVVVSKVRAQVGDLFAPILEMVSQPAATVARAIEAANRWSDVYAENARLRQANAELLQWRQAALRLQAENRALQGLLHYKPDPAASYITARVIADTGSSFVRSLLLSAGARDGVRKGQAAMAGAGLIGRVVEVGRWSSRILLLSDINSRVPVVVGDGQMRAVLAGDNSDLPQLLYLPPEARVKPGDRVVTSGVGGLFPQGLPVGVVQAVAGHRVTVSPYVDSARQEVVQLVDFGLDGGLRALAGADATTKDTHGPR